MARMALICDDAWQGAANITDHINALVNLTRHEIVPFNSRPGLHPLGASFDDFHGLIIHHSVNAMDPVRITVPVQQAIRAFSGLKIQFFQDEYQNPKRLFELSRSLGVDCIFSLMQEDLLDRLYPEAAAAGVSLHTVLPAYAPGDTVTPSLVPMGERSIDVGYRARDVPWYMGAAAREKATIAQSFAEHVEGKGLVLDLSTEESGRLYGEDWIRFLHNCKCHLATESGASVVDIDGTLEQAVIEYQRENPNAEYADVYLKLIEAHDDKLPYKTISPRVFEAIAARTALIMYPGYHSGIVEPWRHYIPLERDLSNIEDVVQKIRDPAFLETLVDSARKEIIVSGTFGYPAFVSEFDRIVEEEFERTGKAYARPTGRGTSAFTRRMQTRWRWMMRKDRAAAAFETGKRRFANLFAMLFTGTSNPAVIRLFVQAVGNRRLASPSAIVRTFLDSIRLTRMLRGDIDITVRIGCDPGESLNICLCPGGNLPSDGTTVQDAAKLVAQAANVTLTSDGDWAGQLNTGYLPVDAYVFTGVSNNPDAIRFVFAEMLPGKTRIKVLRE